jgi:hypothetical protein
MQKIERPNIRTAADTRALRRRTDGSAAMRMIFKNKPFSAAC